MQTKFTAVFVFLVVVTMFIGEGSTDSTKDLEEVLKTSFKAYDTNGDGLVLISDKLRAKIQEEAEKLGLKKLKDDVVDSFLTRADTSKDGKLSLSELQAALKNINLLKLL